MDHTELYDIAWQAVRADGRQQALFGDACADTARKAFRSCAAGTAMPIVYLEVPLLGEPRFDLQVCLDRESLIGGYDLPAAAPEHERALLEWLTSAAGADCQGVDLAFDISSQGLESPQLITLMREGTLSDAEGFFALAGTPDAARRYREAEQRIPLGWRSWYTGIIPGRPGSPIRLDYFVDHKRLRSYTQDRSQLSHDLECAGYQPSTHQLAWCEELLAFPCDLNLQLDLRDDGSLGPVLGYNLAMGYLGPRQIRESIEHGWMQGAFERIEGWSLSDSRWQLISGLCQGKVLHLKGSPADTGWMTLACKPTFVKVRMTQDELVDAKVYVMCVLSPMGANHTSSIERGPWSSEGAEVG